MAVAFRQRSISPLIQDDKKKPVIPKLCIRDRGSRVGDLATAIPIFLSRISYFDSKYSWRETLCHATTRVPCVNSARVAGILANLLERGLKVKEYELRHGNLSETGDFSFGIQEHIDLGARYNSGIGIFGMNFYVVMDRPGARVARRRQ
ncbi:hypothetical protein K438DRAFT_1779439 [Mycena galopus ATCC 62051]|nr:hypothetical protein K438DRAFT_1779439 [Mycena galopus ATCC 62051]